MACQMSSSAVACCVSERIDGSTKEMQVSGQGQSCKVATRSPPLRRRRGEKDWSTTLRQCNARTMVNERGQGRGAYVVSTPCTFEREGG